MLAFMAQLFYIIKYFIVIDCFPNLYYVNLVSTLINNE